MKITNITINSPAFKLEQHEHFAAITFTLEHNKTNLLATATITPGFCDLLITDEKGRELYLKPTAKNLKLTETLQQLARSFYGVTTDRLDSSLFERAQLTAGTFETLELYNDEQESSDGKHTRSPCSR